MPDPYQSQYGAEFKAIREAAGWTRYRVGKELGISASFVTQMEEGKRPLHWITPCHAADLEEAMGVDPDEGEGPIWHLCVRSAAEAQPWVACLWGMHSNEALGEEGKP